MGLEGTPMIEGTWMNKTTGKKIQIRDSVIDGDDMLLMTNEGTQITMRDFSSNYIQVSDEYYDGAGNVITDDATLKKIEKQEREVSKPDITSMVAQNVDDDFFNRLQEKNNAVNTTASTVTVNDYEEHTSRRCDKQKKREVSVSHEMLDKLFTKVKIRPRLNVTDCDNFPTQQLRMLKEFYDVTDDDIAEYLIEYIFTNDDMKSMIIDFLYTKFDEK